VVALAAARCCSLIGLYSAGLCLRRQSLLESYTVEVLASLDLQLGICCLNGTDEGENLRGFNTGVDMDVQIIVSE
jgi:hypothetical protein